MSRKYLVISGVVIVIAVIAMIILSLLNTRKKQGNIINKEQANNLPAGATADIPKVGAMRVENINNSTQIKRSYNDYISQDYKNFRYYETDGISEVFSPSDKDVNLVPLETFFDSVGAKINPKIKSIAGVNYYGLFYCINEKKQKEYGIALDLSEKDSIKTKSNFDKAGSVMSGWEPYLLKDLHHILFPSSNLDEKYINQSIVFQDGQYRYAEINFPDGKNSINYEVVGNPLNLIIITTSQSCLGKSIRLFSALD